LWISIACYSALDLHVDRARFDTTLEGWLVKQIIGSDLARSFPPYPAAVKHEGLVFVSGVRAGGKRNFKSFADLPEIGRAKEQGFALADYDEGQVAGESWSAHANLDAILKASGSAGDQILRQHVWQRDKRFFPCYEEIRKHVQPTPAPSSGLGVAQLAGSHAGWIGLDAIAVAPADNPLLGARTVNSAVNNPNLPSASHYSQAVSSGDLVFTAGHIAIKTAEPGKPLVNSFDDIPPEGRFLATGRSHPDSRDGPIAAQTWYVYNELKKLLAAGNLSFSDVVLSTVFLSDVRDFAVFHRVHRHFFPEKPPALCVTGFDEVGHRGCRIEIELTAVRKGSPLKVRSIDWKIPAPFAAPAACVVGPFTFYSGMLGLDRDARLVFGADAFSGEARALVRQLEQTEARPGVAAQSFACLERLAEAAEAAGSGLDKLLKLTLYLTDPRDLAVFEAVRAHFLADKDLPAFECVSIFGPGPIAGAVMQIEAIGAA
jgi:enamine deaminase RidA (YjgF/YER057c/UK114 family)